MVVKRKGGVLKARTTLVSLAVFLAGAAVGIAADDVWIGTWKLNESKSKLGTGATKNHTVIYTAVGNDVKVIVDGVTSDGKPVHHEWTGKFDGKDYPSPGDPDAETRSYRIIDDRTLEFVGKKAGQVTVMGRIVHSADGRIPDRDRERPGFGGQEDREHRGLRPAVERGTSE